jgi:hypothetical protein
LAALRAQYGAAFTEEIATDNIHTEFTPDKRKKKGFGLLGMVISFAIGQLIGPGVGDWLKSGWGLSEGSALYSFSQQAISTAIGSTASAVLSGGDLNPGNLLKGALLSGLTSAAFTATGLDAGFGSPGGGLSQALSSPDNLLDYSARLLARGVVKAGIESALNDTSFGQALRHSLVMDISAAGARQAGQTLPAGSLGNALAHAAIGGARQALLGGDFASGAIGGLSGALLNPVIEQAFGSPDDPGHLVMARQTALSMLAAGVVAGALGGDPLHAASAAANETVNNYLSQWQQAARERELAQCGQSPYCQARIMVRYGATDLAQDVLLAEGLVIGGTGWLFSSVEESLAFVRDLPRTLSALAGIMADPAQRAQALAAVRSQLNDPALADPLFADLEARVAFMQQNYEQAGPYAQDAGIEAARLLADASALLTGVGGLAKAAPALTARSVRLLDDVVADHLAHSGGYGRGQLGAAGDLSTLPNGRPVMRYEYVPEAQRFRDPASGQFISQQQAARSVGWRTENNDWWWPPNDGFAGKSVPNTLPTGTVIDRFGDNDSAQYFAPPGTSLGARSLPPDEARPLVRYEVLKPLPVQSGTAAPWFDRPGGGVQFKTDKELIDLIASGYLKKLP